MALSALGFGRFVPPVIDIVLVNVDRSRAGAASGALATTKQVGGAILGIVFFGLNGHNTPAAATAQSPTVQSALVAAETPFAVTNSAATAFDRCLTERARAVDPTVTHPAAQCRPALLLPSQTATPLLRSDPPPTTAPPALARHWATKSWSSRQSGARADDVEVGYSCTIFVMGSSAVAGTSIPALLPALACSTRPCFRHYLNASAVQQMANRLPRIR